MSNSMYDSYMDIITATNWIIKIILPIQMVFGTFGNVLNIIIFTRPNLRINPCSTYFLVSSINNLLSIYLNTLVEYVSAVWNSNLLANNNILCKISILIRYIPFSLIIWFPVLASIDRFLSSCRSVRLRQLSSLTIARRVIVSTYTIFLLSHIHMLVYYESSSTDSQFICMTVSLEYILFVNIFDPLVTCILPIFFMCVFGILIVYNVRGVRNRIVTHSSTVRNERLRSNDRQMTKMILIQILITTLISLPYAGTSVSYTVGLFLVNYSYSLLVTIIYQCAKVVAILLYHTNPVIGFYIYVLTNLKFRNEMKHCLRLAFNIVLTKLSLIRFPTATITDQSKRIRNQIHPVQ
ncbi:hypothetical protein I4U23_017106 [Adineta vaga]|nr:hypothetical protein I4U23_017106 [Adineta vaga]